MRLPSTPARRVAKGAFVPGCPNSLNPANQVVKQTLGESEDRRVAEDLPQAHSLCRPTAEPARAAGLRLGDHSPTRDHARRARPSGPVSVATSGAAS
jgi:hypothetical protein